MAFLLLGVTKPLVIVESPAKARTIAGFLGDGYVVESSIGHIRDLPRNAADIPATHKSESWARLGVDVDNGFKPLYVVSREKKEHVTKLKRLVKEASEVYLATDEDREGESIAWHLLEVLNPKVPVRRMVFHEITRPAIDHAIANPRGIDRRLVDAQETRRILDRLYGYEVSPVLWKKVMPKLSAGRVQSVATRIVVERERARMRFRPARYWGIDGSFATGPACSTPGAVMSASLVSIDQVRLATGKDFGEDGEVNRNDVVVLDQSGAEALAAELMPSNMVVRSVETKPYRRRPAAPFMTSTLQQEAGRKLRMSSAQAMRTAQSLYEGGYITYMRTDSTTLSESALSAARSKIAERYGDEYLPSSPRLYSKKVKNAQEAHEAIRPAGDSFRDPESVAAEVGHGEALMYEMIWQRTIASQMNDAVGETMSVRLGTVAPSGKDVEFSASGTVITFQGYQRAYIESTDDDAGSEDAEQQLPALNEGDQLESQSLLPGGHETSPPARFTEASLVRALEELGVGRPSTYAATIGTIQDRGYVWKKGTALIPSFTAFAVVTLLERHFPDLVDYAFTARMEDELDEIANGRAESVPWLTQFYFGTDGAESKDSGSAEVGLQRMVTDKIGDIDAREVSTIHLGVDSQGVEVIARVGKYGPYILRGDEKANIPEDTIPDELTVERALAYLAAPSEDRVLGVDPQSGLDVIAKAGRYGPYVQLGELIDGAKEKPKTASLFKTMALESISLDEALGLLSLPRVVAVDPADGVEITAQNGRFGPYVKKGTDSRSLETEEQIFTIDLEGALRIFAEPKRRGRQAAAPLRELGVDPVSGRPMVVKDGRFGLYVTDGETNASLRRGDDLEGLTDERAAELLADRRARGPATKKPAAKKKAVSKKAVSKKAATKKAVSKKAVSKKAATKKAATKKAISKEGAEVVVQGPI